MNKYNVRCFIHEIIEYEAENEQDAISNMMDWVKKNINRSVFEVELVEKDIKE